MPENSERIFDIPDAIRILEDSAAAEAAGQVREATKQIEALTLRRMEGAPEGEGSIPESGLRELAATLGISQEVLSKVMKTLAPTPDEMRRDDDSVGPLVDKQLELDCMIKYILETLKSRTDPLNRYEFRANRSYWRSFWSMGTDPGIEFVRIEIIPGLKIFKWQHNRKTKNVLAYTKKGIIHILDPVFMHLFGEYFRGKCPVHFMVKRKYPIRDTRALDQGEA